MNYAKVIEKLKALEAAQEGNAPSWAAEIAAIRAEIEAWFKPGAQVCWVEGIQEHGSAVLTTGYCAFPSYADGDRYIKELRERNSHLEYVKLFPIYFKEAK